MANARDKLPAAKQLELYRLELENAESALESIPGIEKAQKIRVEQAQERLSLEQAQLERVQKVEQPEAEQRVKELKAKVLQLSKRTR